MYRGPRAQQVQRGTTHFSPGTKVYCGQVLWGDGYEHIAVIGRHRGSRRYAALVVPWQSLTNWRVQPVYEPALYRAMEAGLPGVTDQNVYIWDKEDARHFAASMRQREATHAAATQELATREVHVWIDETLRGLTRDRLREHLLRAEDRRDGCGTPALNGPVRTRATGP